MSERNKIAIISGPTATGKTGLSIDLAKRFDNYEWAVVNFDSLLFYNDLNIGTAKPSAEEMLEVEHHLVNVNSIANEINAADFVQLALDKIEELHRKGIIPILVGGSTFYLRSLLKGMYSSTTSNETLKEEISKIYKYQGIEPFILYLNEHDPQSVEELHENDHYRLQRAYEHHRLTGQPISLEKQKLDDQDPYDFSKHIRTNWDILHFSLDIPKEQHWPLIEERTTEMVNDGLILEVKNILAQGFSGEEKPLQSIGYKETISYLRGQDISSIDDLIERIYIATRRLAKSQRTFLKKVTPKIKINVLENKEEVFNHVENWLRK